MSDNLHERHYMFFFVKQKTAYVMRISDWSSDVCSSDLSKACPRWRHRGLSQDRVVVHRGQALLPQRFTPTLEETRSEERRVRKESVSTCRSRWSTYD